MVFIQFKILRISEKAQSFSYHQYPYQGVLQVPPRMSPRSLGTIWKLIMALGLGPWTTGYPAMRWSLFLISPLLFS